MLKLYKGDDTNFKNLRTILIVLKSVSFPLDGCYGEFVLCGQKTKVSPLAAGSELPIVFNHFQTSQMTLGEHHGVFKIVDKSMRVRTVASDIPVLVSDDADEVYGTDNRAEIRVSQSYNTLSDLPQIGGHELKGGNNGYGELGLLSKVNGIEGGEDGNVRIPKVFLVTSKPDTTIVYDEIPEGFMEGDREFVVPTGMMYVLASVSDEMEAYRWVETKADVRVLDGIRFSLKTDNDLYYAVSVIVEKLGGTVEM